METILIIINLISNIILCLSGAGFYLAVFGRKTSIVNKWPILGYWSLRIGLASFFTGTLFNILTIYTPELTQIILSGFGSAPIFSYIYIKLKSYGKSQSRSTNVSSREK